MLRWAPFGSFLKIFGQAGIFLENSFLSLFSIFRFLLRLNFRKKANEQIPRKSGYRHPDR